MQSNIEKNYKWIVWFTNIQNTIWIDINLDNVSVFNLTMHRAHGKKNL